MIKIMKKLLLILSLAAFTLSSCDKGFLEKKPLDSYSEEDVYSNDQMCEAYVNTMYNVIPAPYSEGSIACCTDEGYFRYGGSSTNYVARGEMTPSKVMYFDEGGSTHGTRNIFINMWNRTYKYVRYMNDFLSKIDGATQVSDEYKKRLKGEVYFLRGWAYGNLLKRVGGFPYISYVFNTLDEANTREVYRDSFDNCVDSIYADLDMAISLLPDKANVQGRACADAARAMKARVAMFSASPLFNDPASSAPTSDNTAAGTAASHAMEPWHGVYSAEKWTTAKNLVYEVIKRAEAGAYSLDNSYEGYWTNINSPEVIWATYLLPTSKNMATYNYSFAQLFWMPATVFGGWVGCAPTENLVEEYEMKATGKRPFETGSGYDATHPWDGRDPRFYKTILYHGSQFSFLKGGTTDSTVTILCGQKAGTAKTNDNFYDETNQCTGYWMRKFMIDHAKVSENQGDNPTLMYPWFRLAEFYLDYAECFFNLGDAVTCCTYINKVRDRADVMMPHVNATGNTLKKKLYHERQIELAFENQRYFDVRRWKIADSTEKKMSYGIIVYKNSEAGDYTYLLATGKNGEADFTALQAKNRAKLAKGDYQSSRNFQPQHYLVPIPQNEVTKSEGRLIQNPYYD